EVHGTGYVWDAPGEGVYHWRLRRPGAVGEGSTFVSGSFAAVEAGVERAKPARLAWEPEPGADRYKLYVIDASQIGVSAPGALPTPRTMTTMEPSFVVPASERDLMIEVVPYSGSRRT